ncbi:transposase [Holospora curviuscula]
MFLPPYLPDLNPVEKFWTHVKRCIKNGMIKFSQ